MIVFVTGGSGSGKSEYAEQLAVELKEKELRRRREVLKDQPDTAQLKLVYLAAMRPADAESRERIRRHRAMRAGKQFETREQYTRLEEIATDKNEILLLECLSNLMANEMFSKEGRGEQAAEAVQKGICRLAKRCCHLVIVGNNMFEDDLNYDGGALEYLRETARVHRFLGETAAQIVEVVCGIPVEWRKP